MTVSSAATSLSRKLPVSRFPSSTLQIWRLALSSADLTRARQIRTIRRHHRRSSSSSACCHYFTGTRRGVLLSSSATATNNIIQNHWLHTSIGHYDNSNNYDDDDTRRRRQNRSNESVLSNWLQMKDEIVSLESPLQEVHWAKAEELLKALRFQPELSNLVRDGFQILDRLSDEYERRWRDGDGMKPQDIPTLYAVLLPWRDGMLSSAESPRDDTLDVESVLKKVERYMKAGLFADDHIRTYNILLHVMSKQNIKGFSNATKALELAEEQIYQPMLRRSKHNPNDIQHHPNCETIYHLVGLLGRTSFMQAPDRVDAYLATLQGWYQQTRASNHRPTAQLYCAVMEAHSRCNRKTHLVPRRIQQLFQQMKAVLGEGKNDDEGDSELVASYNRTCHALAECQDPNACDIARSILDEMCHEYFVNDKHNFKPTQQTFGSILIAYGRAKRSKEAEALFDRMEQLAEESGDDSFRPGTICYNDLIWAYAAVGNAQQAETTLLRMLATIEEGHQGDLAFTVRAWSGVMAAWASSGDVDSVRHVERLMGQLKEMEKSDALEGELNATTYNRLLAAYCKQGTVEAAKSAENLFRWMETHKDLRFKPNSDSCLSVIVAWSGTGRPDKSDEFLRDVVEKGNVALLDKSHFGVAIEAWATSGDTYAAEKAQSLFDLMLENGLTPDVVGFSSVMWAWARSQNSDPAQHVERLFWQMHAKWKSGDDLLRPNEVTVHALLYGLLQSKDPSTVERAEELFRKIHGFGVRRDSKMYNTLMSAWANRQHPERVEFWFHEMKDEFNAGETAVRPGLDSYITRLHAWSLAGSPEMASQVIKEMVAQYEDGNLEKKPSTFQFNAVLRACLRSRRENSAEMAESGLRQMIHFHETGQFNCPPDLHSFNSVLVAYANSRLPQAGAKAMSLLQELKEMSIAPNFHTYTEVMTAIIRSGDPRGEQWLRQLLGELHKNDDRFWSGRETEKNFRRLFRSLELNGFGQIHALATEIKILEHTALTAGKRLPLSSHSSRTVR